MHKHDNQPLVSEEVNNQIIQWLEDLPEEKRTGKDVYTLSLAYHRRNVNNDRKEADRIIELLHTVEEEMSSDYEWNRLLSTLYYEVENPEKGIHYLNRMMEAGLYTEEVDKVIERAKEHFDNLLFEFPNRKRVDFAWTEFMEREGEFRHRLEMGDDRETLFNDVSEIFASALGEGEPVYLEEIDGHFIMIFSLMTSRHHLFEAAYCVAHVPENLPKEWHVGVGLPAMENFEIGAGDEVITKEDVTVWIRQETGEDRQTHYAFDVYSDKLLFENEQEQIMAALHVDTMFERMLGEVPAIRLGADYTLLEMPKDEPGIPMGELYDTLTAMGAPLDGNVHWCYRYNQKPYSRPKRAVMNVLREDIFEGETAIPELDHDYMSKDPLYVAKYRAMGAFVGFFHYDVKMFDSEDQQADMQEALKEFLSTLAGDAMVVIGGGIGTKKNYIDFIAWDFEKALRAYAAVAKVYSLQDIGCKEFMVGAESFAFAE